MGNNQETCVSKMMTRSRDSKMWQESLELLVPAAVPQQVIGKSA